MKLTKLFLLSLLPVAMTACDDPDSPVETFEDNYTANFTYSKNTQTGEAKLLEGAEYSMYFDFTAGTLQLGVKDLRYAEGMPTVSFTVPPKTFSFDDDRAWVLSVPSFAFSDNGAQHTVSNLKFTDLSRISGNNNYRVINVSFTIDGQYEVRAVQQDMLYFCATTVTAEGQATFQTTTPTYVIALNRDTKKATITINRSRYNANMPELDMVFPDVPFEVDMKGYTLECEVLTPTIKGVPFPMYAITALSAQISANGTGALEYDCTVNNPSIPVPTTFHIAVDLMLFRK